MNQLFAIIVALVILVIFIVIRHSQPNFAEDFANVDSKATVLSNWFAQHGQSARYVDYIRDNPDSNIVEYSRLRDILVDGKINNHATVVETLRI